MVFKNADVVSFHPETPTGKRDIYVDGGLFAKSADGEAIDCSGLTAIPGLIDLHLHGCAGYDFCGGGTKPIGKMAEYLARNGITAFNPATMTLPEEKLIDVCRSAREFYDEQRSAKYENASIFTGITMEGPFFNPEKRGAQSPEYMLPPDIGLLERMQAASGGLVKIACVSPELPGAMEYISAASRFSTVSLAHTAADYDTAIAAFNAGATHVTHLFNAMNPLLHRNPGIAGAAFDSGANVELICDGKHLHPAVVRAAVSMFGADRCVLISDSMMATGLGDGEYTLGANAVRVKAGRALLADGTVAGSVANLMDCLRKAVAFGVPFAAAVRMCSLNPARVLGLDSVMGSIETGKYANFVLLDDSLDIKAVYIRGRAVFSVL